MALATTASRVTGLLRTLAIAWALGATALGDAYNVANTAPNMVFQLAAGGVLSASIVPVLARSGGDDARRETAAVLYGAVVIAGVLASVALAVGAPWVVAVLTAGSRGRADHAQLAATATTWLRWFSPQVLAYALGVFGVAVMTFHRKLVLGAAASVATNVVTIAGALAFVATAQAQATRPSFAELTQTPVVLLGAATTVGVAVMAVLQLAGAHRVERSLRPRFALRHPAVRRVLTLAPWVGLYVVVNQAGLAAVTAMASSVAGGVSAYQWAFTVMQLPHAVVAVTLISASFPKVSRQVADGTNPSATIERTLRSMVRVLVPAAAILAATAPLLGRALVGDAGAALVAAGILGFAMSLVPFSVFQLGTRISYAFEDTRRPAVVNIAVNLANLGADAAVILLTDDPRTRVAGLALGHALSYVVGVALLGRTLARRRGVALLAGARGTAPAIAIAAASGCATYAVAQVTDPADQLSAALAAGVAGAAGAIVFGAAVLVMATRRTPRGTAA